MMKAIGAVARDDIDESADSDDIILPAGEVRPEYPVR